LTLLFYARNKPACWPSDPAFATRIGRYVGTVQRSLRRLEVLGLAERRKTTANPTGRLLVLRWRATPVAPVTDPLVSSTREEGRSPREKERPVEIAGPESPLPPSGERTETPAPQRQ
jgi:hypothetical protein